MLHLSTAAKIYQEIVDAKENELHKFFKRRQMYLKKQNYVDNQPFLVGG